MLNPWTLLGGVVAVAILIYLLARAARPYADDTYEPPHDPSATRPSDETKWSSQL